MSSAATLPSEEEYPSVHLLILITGSVAAVKTGLLLDQLSSERCNIRIAATQSAFHFLHRAQPSKTGIPFQSIIADELEWSEWQVMSDLVVHIELRRWADLVVIAPLDANSLAKIATGLCDNLVTSVMRAWEVQRKPVIVCPAMNTAMWMHPITTTQLSRLAEWYLDREVVSSVLDAGAFPPEGQLGAESPTRRTEPPPTGLLGRVPYVLLNGEKAAATEMLPPPTPAENADTAVGEVSLPATLKEAMFQVVGPVCKRLACGDTGVGGMASVEEIALHIRHTMELIREKKKLQYRQQLSRQEAANSSQSPSLPLVVPPADGSAVQCADPITAEADKKTSDPGSKATLSSQAASTMTNSTAPQNAEAK